MMGRVSLVGAGPGDADLLTLRALRRLGEADLVLYDALVSSDVLEQAPQARRFFVGKRAGRAGLAQEAIHALMIRWARRGRHVVRLKCGDPFVFGRGGEEMQALAAAGVPVEVIPGVSAVLAAPALSGIPLTHRGVASAFVVVSGHAAEAYGPLLDALGPGTATVVVLMGLTTRAQIAQRLLARGWRAETPAAILLDAGTPRAAVWSGALAQLGAAPLPDTLRAVAGTIVIGEVVGLARQCAAPAVEWEATDAADEQGARDYAGT